MPAEIPAGNESLIRTTGMVKDAPVFTTEIILNGW